VRHQGHRCEHRASGDRRREAEELAYRLPTWGDRRVAEESGDRLPTSADVRQRAQRSRALPVRERRRLGAPQLPVRALPEQAAQRQVPVQAQRLLAEAHQRTQAGDLAACREAMGGQRRRSEDGFRSGVSSR
jgi:hypothetical protein